MNIQEAKNISIISILDSLGIKPTKINDKQAWYHSPFRAENTPSFSVSVTKNVFYDFGDSTYKGNVIDFVMLYYKCDVKEALKILANNSFSVHQQLFNPQVNQDEKDYEITAIKPLRNKYLIYYIKQRGLCIKTTQRYCKEIHYILKDKAYYAIGFQNELDGVELRNKYVQMCFGSKYPTYINNDSSTVFLFEAFIDFLSFITLKPNLEHRFDYIILNSVNTLESTLIQSSNKFLYKTLDDSETFESKYKTIVACFDNDTAGDKATEKLIAAFPLITKDARAKYKDYKDVNDYLLSINRDKLT
ncbi:toprim domain-containing protein [Myroides odoratimimus]|uniref:toprim domain-containing protein n=1 Tax=Myroides odoratimimus TaxID=76832 RepID=UPI00257665A1|nr:toprim domain-containing protein [Myroides odoratimimus]MDM1466019.1 toprim domain-containing protein [Myroides odoratimimus]MDM1469323.1 toprim domain-containing protein [Myroides odoratimimus]MDM1479254.1 toprim domain-containing protein [Myroides odoratimimus]